MEHTSRTVQYFMRKKFFIPLFLVLAIGVLLLSAFRSVGTWMTASDPLPDSLDIICTFAGDRHRVTYSKELMKKYRNAHWILSDYKNGYARLLRKSNYPMNRVTVIDTSANTLSEINACKIWIRSYLNNPSTAPTQLQVGFISSPYHMRRIHLMAKRKLTNPSIQYYLLPVPKERYHWTDKSFKYWWRSRRTTSIVFTELAKTAYFYLTGYFR